MLLGVLVKDSFGWFGKKKKKDLIALSIFPERRLCFFFFSWLNPLNTVLAAAAGNKQTFFLIILQSGVSKPFIHQNDTVWHLELKCTIPVAVVASSCKFMTFQSSNAFQSLCLFKSPTPTVYWARSFASWATANEYALQRCSARFILDPHFSVLKKE